MNKLIIGLMVSSAMLGACGIPTGDELYHQMQTKYENEYHNAKRYGATDGQLCARIGVAIIDPLNRGDVNRIRRWGSREIDHKCVFRTFKTHRDLDNALRQ